MGYTCCRYVMCFMIDCSFIFLHNMTSFTFTCSHSKNRLSDFMAIWCTSAISIKQELLHNLCPIFHRLKDIFPPPSESVDKEGQLQLKKGILTKKGKKKKWNSYPKKIVYLSPTLFHFFLNCALPKKSGNITPKRDCKFWGEDLFPLDSCKKLGHLYLYTIWQNSILFFFFFGNNTHVLN